MVSPDYENEVEEKLYDFSTALDALKKWDSVAREWWNWKWLYITLQNPDSNSKMTRQYLFITAPAWNWNYKKQELIPWLASQSDLLSEDWYIL